MTSSLPIDLRSDTVTRPSPGMLAAMLAASVGDDVYGEDPTINALQDRVATMFGKEAALFVPSGTMSNQLAIKAHTRPGDEILVEAECHVFHYESASPAHLSGVQSRTVPGQRGVMDVRDVEAAIRPPDYYYPPTSLVCIENTHNRAGGAIYPLKRIRELSDFCRARKLPLHMDGARIWNAHVATGIPLIEFGSAVDTISVCFSKGLGAPVGSVLAGPEDFIRLAHRMRKGLGGGMRQAGILAAACLYALDQNLPLLKEDHRRAKRFAEICSESLVCTVHPEEVETNMVMMDFRDCPWTPAQAQQALAEQGVIIGQGPAGLLRAVFHLDVDDGQVERAIDVLRHLFGRKNR